VGFNVKNYFCLPFLIIIFLCLSVGCSDNRDTSNSNLAIGNYQFQGTDESLKPFVNLKENNEFVFVYSAISSYIPVGTYEINQDNLILTTDDGKYEYVFKIKNNTVIFNKEASDSYIGDSLKDGAVFILERE